MDRVDIETAVIGAGVVGLSIARQLAMRDRDVVIFDSAPKIGFETSSRNSGVIHAGMYYPNGSIKSEFCVAGRKLLYVYAQNRDIPVKNTGKLIVATKADQIGQLVALKEHAERNGVQDMQILSQSEARQLEEQIACAAALHVPCSGQIEVHALMDNLLADAENARAILMLNTKIVKSEITARGFVLEAMDTQGRQTRVECKMLVNAAGLGAQDIARNMEGFDAKFIPEQELGKGNYFSLSASQAPFKMLVYPLPVPGSSGLHYRQEFDGRAIFGPDLEIVKAIDYATNDTRRAEFEKSIVLYWPDLPKDALQPDYTGIRPKIKLGNGAMNDFMVLGPRQHGIDNLIQLFGVESPGLTASMGMSMWIGASLAPRRGEYPAHPNYYRHRLV